MNIILLFAHEIVSGVVELPANDRRAIHIVSILKPELGAKLRVGIVNGGIGLARVWLLDCGGVILNLEKLTLPLQSPQVELLLAVPRPNVMARLWKCFTELGLHRIILSNAWRVNKSYFKTTNIAAEKYQPRLLEGLEQATVDTRMPEVLLFERIRPLVEDQLDMLCPPRQVLRLLCHPRGTMRVPEAIARASPEFRRVLLAIGPEGGWIDKEVEMLERHGFQMVSLGPRVLTTELAVACSTALAMDALSAQICTARNMTKGCSVDQAVETDCCWDAGIPASELESDANGARRSVERPDEHTRASIAAKDIERGRRCEHQRISSVPRVHRPLAPFGRSRLFVSGSVGFAIRLAEEPPGESSNLGTSLLTMACALILFSAARIQKNSGCYHRCLQDRSDPLIA